MSEFACKVCGNTPDPDGILEHGRGCYTQDADGGGSEYVEDADQRRHSATQATHRNPGDPCPRDERGMAQKAGLVWEPEYEQPTSPLATPEVVQLRAENAELAAAVVAHVERIREVEAEARRENTAFHEMWDRAVAAETQLAAKPTDADREIRRLTHLVGCLQETIRVQGETIVREREWRHKWLAAEFGE